MDEQTTQEPTRLTSISEHLRIAQQLIEATRMEAIRDGDETYELGEALARVIEADMWIKRTGHAGYITR